jgi:hypothetical protein
MVAMYGEVDQVAYHNIERVRLFGSARSSAGSVVESAKIVLVNLEGRNYSWRWPSKARDCNFVFLAVNGLDASLPLPLPWSMRKPFRKETHDGAIGIDNLLRKDTGMRKQKEWVLVFGVGVVPA